MEPNLNKTYPDQEFSHSSILFLLKSNFILLFILSELKVQSLVPLLVSLLYIYLPNILILIVLLLRMMIIIIIITIIIIIIIIISFMQGIYIYIPETKYVPKEYSVAAILLFLFMVLISLVPVLNLLYFYISTFRNMCAVPKYGCFL